LLLLLFTTLQALRQKRGEYNNILLSCYDHTMELECEDSGAMSGRIRSSSSFLCFSFPFQIAAFFSLLCAKGNAFNKEVLLSITALTSVARLAIISRALNCFFGIVYVTTCLPLQLFLNSSFSWYSLLPIIVAGRPKDLLRQYSGVRQLRFSGTSYVLSTYTGVRTYCNVLVVLVLRIRDPPSNAVLPHIGFEQN
jgi:hypothetical protein